MDKTFDISEEELPIFLAEADEQFQILDEGLVELEHKTEDSELLQALFRAAHTLKGSAGMIGHKRMVELTHALEAALDGLRKQTLQVSPDLIDTCLQAVDILRLLCSEVSGADAGQVEIGPLVDRFSSFSSTGAAEARPGGQGPGEEKDTVQEAAAKGQSAPITVRASISPESIVSAARAFQIILALQEMGEIVSMEPSQAQIETAAPVYEFTARFLPAEPVHENSPAEIHKVLSSIPEIDRLTIEGEAPCPEKAKGTTEPVHQTEETGARLGEYLIRSGLINEEQLRTAIQIQQGETGPTPLLGQVLIKSGAITQEMLDLAIAEQNKGKKHAVQQETQSAAQERSPLRAADKTVRTSIERLDNLMNLVGELITGRNRLNLIRVSLESKFRGDEQFEALAGTITHIGRITDQLQGEVTSIRMLPISNVFNKFPRLVRDLARNANKQIDLVIRGEDTELDRSVIEVISDPLIHLLRNAVDHGIETPEQRTATGKPERGVILLTARHEQGRIYVTVEDNGRGIDLQAVRKRAVEKGHLSKAEADALPDEDAKELIFYSGLSTAKLVTDVSGRGVGMDIVRSNIERLNGNIVVETWPGRGTQFQIVLPLTLAIIPTLLVRVCGATYAIPLVTVTETSRIPTDRIQTVNNKPVILLRDHVIPVIRLAEIFDLPGHENGSSKSPYEYTVFVRSGKSHMGLMVDALVGEQEVVVKSLSSVIGDVPGVASTAILGDGQVSLILDVQGLFKLASTHPNGSRRYSAKETS